MAKEKYIEPVDFIPKDIRKKLKLGEYNDEVYPQEDSKKKENRDLNKKIRDYVNKK